MRVGLARKLGRVGVVVVSALAALLVVNGQAMAAGSWNNNSTTLTIKESGRFVGTAEVAIWTGSQKASYRGRIWGSGFDVTTQSEYLSYATYRGYVRIDRNLPVGSRVCAEGFRFDGSKWQSIGLPCTTITD